MTREILFKAKRKDNGEWVYGDLINRSCSTNIGYYDDMAPTWNDPCGSQEWVEYEVDRETVCQYTGLKFNDVLIWENDIVRIAGHIMVISFFKASFCTILSSGPKYLLDTWAMEAGEIIGNKFDHPELLTP
jgi:uncharacterized phage protein (TIGR01671 family)